MGLLNNSLHFAKKLHKASAPTRSKKSVQPCPERRRREGRSRLTRGAYAGCVSANVAKSDTSVSPNVGKRARTPLAAFFNIPLHEKRSVSSPRWVVSSAGRAADS